MPVSITEIRTCFPGRKLGYKSGFSSVTIFLVSRSTVPPPGIRENTPAETRFLVEGFRIYDGRSAVGADAGWWIPLLAGRANTMPPQYALLNERPIDPDYSRNVVALVAGLEANSPATTEGMRLLCEQGITHVYIGQSQGKVGFAAPQLFAPEDFAPQPAFDLVYHEDRVYVFAFDRATCPAQ